MNLKDKNISVIGLGRTGIALIKYLHSRGANIFVSDEKPLEELTDAITAIKEIPVTLEAGGHTDSIYQNKDLIIISPGADIGKPVFTKASRSVEIISEIEFAYRMAKAPILAVTGTNGKSTTTALVYEIIRSSGAPCALGGNIGNPLINEAEKAGSGGYLVSEVSTFQLEAVKNFKPLIGFILNITPDHIDRHGSMGKYVRLKARVFENQDENDYLILNYDDEYCRTLAGQARSQVYFFSRRAIPPRGAFLDKDTICLKTENPNGASRLIKLDEMAMKGVHNVENALAAACIIPILDIDPGVFKKVLSAFKPMHHRLEFVRQINGVKFYDDSKGTNPACVIAALSSFTEPIILIAGGRPKETDFSGMAKLITEKVKHLVLVGEAKDLLEKEVLKHKNMPIYKTNNFEDAVGYAHKISSKGDVVVLSPACTSFDMFKNAEERGDRFQEIVRGLVKSKE